MPRGLRSHDRYASMAYETRAAGVVGKGCLMGRSVSGDALAVFRVHGCVRGYRQAGGRRNCPVVVAVRAIMVAAAMGGGTRD